MNIQLHDPSPAGSRARRRSRGHLRLPEHRRHRQRFPGREAARPSTTRLTWFVDRGVIHRRGREPRPGAGAGRPAHGSRDLARIHSVRSALREVASRSPSTGRPTPARSSSINRALHARQVIELVAGARTACSVDHRHVGDPIDDALARLTEPLVTELTEGHPERIKICASETCDWIFYDSSRTSRRRWCDMATCGNRAKAARHRARTKAGSSGANAQGAGGVTDTDVGRRPTPYSL